MPFEFKEIDPSTTKNTIDLNSKIYLVKDHIPDLENLLPLDQLKTKNSIDYLLDNQCNNLLFVFDYYLGFEDFDKNGFFYPGFLIGCIEQYKERLDRDTLEFDWKEKTVPLNCLMNKERIHRILISDWLHSQIDWKNKLIYSQSWDLKFSTTRTKIAKYLYYNSHLENKNKKISELPRNWFSFRHQPQEEYRYKNNVEIFNETLSESVFSKSIISIVAEPDFWPNASAVTEKYINAVVGLTLPIVTGYKIYEKLRAIGLDTFDDIIATDYQYELDPTQRIWKMMESNRVTFFNAQKIIQDDGVKNRLLANRDKLFDIKSIKAAARKNLNSAESEKVFSPHTKDILDYFRNHNGSW